jgi:hypothetical protein
MSKISITRTKAPTPEGAAAKKKRLFGKETGEQAAYKFQGQKPRRSAAAKADAPPAPTSPSKMISEPLEKLDTSPRPRLPSRSLVPLLVIRFRL